jgi:hypothetical protein
MATGDVSQWEVGAAKGVKAGGRTPWGFVSITNGAASILGALIAAVVNVDFWQWPPLERADRVAVIGTAVGLTAALGVTSFGIMARLWGSRTGRDSPPRSLLATAGIVIGAGAMLLWIIVGIDLLASLSSFAG